MSSEIIGMYTREKASPSTCARQKGEFDKVEVGPLTPLIQLRSTLGVALGELASTSVWAPSTSRARASALSITLRLEEDAVVGDSPCVALHGTLVARST